MQQSGLVVLTTATDGSFNGPSVGHLVAPGGSEMLLHQWDLSAFLTDGIFSDITTDLLFTLEWGPGDPLRLYWYPDLTLLSDISTELTAGMSYGSYTDTSDVSDGLGLDGSAPWETPLDESDTINLRFFTADAGFLNLGGSNSEAAGEANNSVPSAGGPPAVPEPGNVLGLSALLAAATQIRLRRPRKSKVN